MEAKEGRCSSGTSPEVLVVVANEKVAREVGVICESFGRRSNIFERKQRDDSQSGETSLIASR